MCGIHAFIHEMNIQIGEEQRLREFGVLYCTVSLIHSPAHSCVHEAAVKHVGQLGSLHY